MAPPGRMRGWFEGKGLPNLRVSPPAPLSLLRATLKAGVRRACAGSCVCSIAGACPNSSRSVVRRGEALGSGAGTWPLEQFPVQKSAAYGWSLGMRYAPSSCCASSPWPSSSPTARRLRKEQSHCTPASSGSRLMAVRSPCLVTTCTGLAAQHHRKRESDVGRLTRWNRADLTLQLSFRSSV